MRHRTKVLAVLLATIVCVAAIALTSATAGAVPSNTTSCHICHGRSDPTPIVTPVSDDGVTATYQVTSTGPWFVFDAQAAGAPSNTRIASGSAPGGTFSGPAGHTFNVEQETAAGIGVTAVGANVFTITSSSGAGGSISPASPQSVAAGDDISFAIKADEDYKVAEVLIDGSSVGAVSSYQFSNVAASHSVSASFVEDVTYTLTYVAGAHGTITGQTSQKISKGGSGTAVTAVPDPGYHFASWSDGLLTATRTDASVTADKSVTASFASNQTATTLTLRASVPSLLHGRYVTLTATLKGGVPAGTKITFKVKAPGKSSYATIATVGTSAKGVALKKYRVAKKGNYYFKAVYAGGAHFKSSSSSAIRVRSK